MASHAKQIEEGVIRSLNRAGIRARYHRASLKAHASTVAHDIDAWLHGESPYGDSRFETDRGFVFQGGNAMYDLAVMTARGLHLTGRAVRVMALIRFQELLAGDRDYL